MYKNLKIDRHDLVDESFLLDLAQINVICGPNNSGKSTILSSINNDRFCHEIISSSSIDPSALLSICESHQPQVKHPQLRHLNEALQKVIKDTINSSDYWGSNQLNIFTQTFFENFNGVPLLRNKWKFGPNLFNSFYPSLFLSELESIIILPKRNIDLEINYNPSENPSPDGQGLLNVLFFSKNQFKTDRRRVIYDRVLSAFTKITNGFTFDIFTSGDGKLGLFFSPRESLSLKASQCGLGLQDLLTILYFIEEGSHKLLLIEEPENHLHPDYQRRLLLHMKTKEEAQFFLTTHSNVFLNNALVEKVLVTKYEDEKISISDATSRASTLDDLGYSVADNLVSDLIVLVEGPTDVPILEEFFQKLNLYEKNEIKIWPLGGDIMDQLDISVFSETYKIIALLDKDPSSSSVRNKFAKICEEKNIPIHILSKYAIENYFSMNALKAVFGSQLPKRLKSIKPNTKLETQIGLNVKKNNRKIAREMTLEDIEGTDFYEFLRKVQKICRS